MIENNMFETLFDIIPFGIYVVDIKNYKIIYMNKSFIEQRGDFIGKTCYENIYGEDTPCYFCKINELVDCSLKAKNNTVTFEMFNPVDDKWYQLQEKAISWPDGRVVKYSIAVDISELKETQNHLAEAHAEIAIKNKELMLLSTTDKLTQLSNRLKIDEILAKSVQIAKFQKSNLGVILIDIDNFKEVNDTYGHQAGDSVLKETAQLINGVLRKTDSIGRWGGEEFLVICPGSDINGTKRLAENIRKMLAMHSFRSKLKKTGSFGVTCLREEDGETTLLKRADDALYRAKNNGKNMVEACE
jgi:diguanylate cyclase (GGDEF)-like protein